MADPERKDIMNSLLTHPDIIRAEQIQVPEGWDPAIRLFSIRYRSSDCEVEGFAAFPPEGEGPWPAVVFNRGGNREFGTLRPGAVCRYAAAGFAGFGSQYRGNAGGTGLEEFGGADVDDVIKLADIALELPCTRKEGYYMAGHSRGGMMTYLAAARDSRIKAAAICAGVSDARIMYYSREDSMKQVCTELIGGTPEELPAEYDKRSATMFADRIIPPLLICQGTDDWRVIPAQAYYMDSALAQAGKEHRLIIYPGADHSLKGTGAYDEVIAWFNAHPL